MKKIICDRCGKEVLGNLTEGNDYEEDDGLISFHSVFEGSKYYDFCEECSELWVKGVAGVNQRISDVNKATRKEFEQKFFNK